MTPVYRSSDSSSSTSASSLIVTKPAGTVDGDVMLAYVYFNTTTVTITPPAGWTLVQTINTTITAKMSVYYKVASGEGADYTFGFSATSRCRAAIHSFYDADTTSPINASGVQAQSSGNVTAPSITTTVANTLVVFLGGVDSGSSWTFTAPSGMTERYDAAAVAPHEVADVAQASAGATGTKSATPSSTVDENAGFLVALAPIPSASTVGLLLMF